MLTIQRTLDPQLLYPVFPPRPQVSLKAGVIFYSCLNCFLPYPAGLSSPHILVDMYLPEKFVNKSIVIEWMSGILETIQQLATVIRFWKLLGH